MEKCECELCEKMWLSEAIQINKKRLEVLDIKSEINTIMNCLSVAKQLFIVLEFEPSEACLSALKKHGLELMKTDIKSGNQTRWDLKFH